MASQNRNWLSRFSTWFQSRWAIPAYGGWVLIGIAISFFGAATNTMAGWLYVLSGMLISLLGLNFISSIANLKKIQIQRLPTSHIHAQDELALQLIVKNPTKKSKILIQVIDRLPAKLGQSITHTIEEIPSYDEVKLTKYVKAETRGIYHWNDVVLKSAAPFGLFSCIRHRQVKSKVVVYPQILPLHNCPLIDDIGAEETQRKYSQKNYQNSTEGITKSLRQYRYGDAMRMIHWRSSAKLGELQVRELETITGGEEVVICLDNSSQWEADLFEEAVKAIASIYFYGSRQQLPINLWIADVGLIHGNQVILETLAGVNYGNVMSEKIPDSPVVWFSADTDKLEALVKGSRYFLFPTSTQKLSPIDSNSYQGIVYSSEMSLINQLQKPLSNL